MNFMPGICLDMNRERGKKRGKIVKKKKKEGKKRKREQSVLTFLTLKP